MIKKYIALVISIALFAIVAPVQSQSCSHKIPIAGYATNAELSPNGQYCIVQLEDESLCIIYDLTKKEILTELECGVSIKKIGFSPDSKYQYIILSNGEVRIYDLAKGKLFSEILHYDVQDIEFSPNGHFIAASCDDGSALLYQLKDNWRQIHSVKHRDRVNGLAFSPNNDLLITASADRRLGIFDLYSKEQNFISAEKPFSYSLQFSYNGKYLIAVLGDWCENQASIIINLHTMQIVKRFPPRPFTLGPGPLPLEFSANGKYVFDNKGFYQIGTWNKLYEDIEYKYISEESNDDIFELPNDILEVKFSPINGAYAVVQKGYLKYYPYLHSREPSKIISSNFFRKNQDGYYVTDIQFSSDGRYLFATDGQFSIMVDTLNSQQLYRDVPYSGDLRGYGFLLSSDGVYLVLVTEKEIQLYSANNLSKSNY